MGVKEAQDGIQIKQRSEYHAIATTVQELEWITTSMYELGILMDLPMPVQCDNLGATYLTSNQIYDHAKTKHIAIDLHFVRERVEDESLQIQHIVGSKQIADILTKPRLFFKMQSKLTNKNLPT